MRDVWLEIWDTLEPMISSVMRTGESTLSVDVPFIMNRSGFDEETCFTFSYSPLTGPDGAIHGVMDIATETTDEVVDRRRLRTLSELSTGLHTADDDVSQLLAAAADLLRSRPDIAGADFYVRDGAAIRLVASTDERPPAARILAARVSTVLRARRPRLRGRILTMPLTSTRTREPVGMIVVEASPLRPFDEPYESFIHLVAGAIGTAAVEVMEHRHEVDQVRGVSDALQRAMLPGQPAARGWFTRYRPADGSLAVGGDWYDVVDLTAGRWGLLVGDCVGHGLAAAALMGQLRSAGRALLLERNGPAGTLEGLDRFARTLPGAEFTTVFCGIVDENTRTMTYASAGHPPGLRIGANGVSWLNEVRGFPLTLGGEARAERTVSLSGGDVVVLYTDGLVERRLETLGVGLDRLARTAQKILATRPVEDLADELIASLATGSRDDVALVVYRMGA